MLIAVDGFEASAEDQVGVGRFEVELLKELHSLDKKNYYRIYTPFKPNQDLPPQTTSWQYKIPPFHRLWSQVTLPLLLTIDTPKPDVFFAPVHYAPRFCPAPVVLGIMDLSFLHFPELFKAADLYKLREWTKYSVKKARAIITISQNSKNDILEEYKVEAKSVHVVYPGVTMSTVNTKTSIEEVKQKYGIRGDYILYVGTLQPRKNIERLIEAFTKIKGPASPNPSQGGSRDQLQLVIAGKKGWLYDEIFKKVQKEHLENDVIFTGYVPEEELSLLYKEALCFCLVSLYEGFGFPVLEAMSLGVPVVASNVSSLPELVGEAGILVNPENTDEIARSIKKILSLSKDAKMKIIELGKKQAKKFTWEKAAKQTISILEEVGHAQR